MPETIRKILSEQSGASSIEYALIAGFMSIAIAVAVYELGSEVNNLFVSVKNIF